MPDPADPPSDRHYARICYDHRRHSTSSCRTLWIGGNTLWGIGIIVGRTRTYRVTQQESLRPPIVEGPSVFNAGGPEAGGPG